MLNNPRYAIVLPLVVAISGCLYESTLDAKGGGVMTATFAIEKKEAVAGITKQMESSVVKVTSAESVSEGAITRGVFKLQFDDVTKLSTTDYFKDVTITRTNGSKPGTKLLTAKLKHDKIEPMPDRVVELYGKELKIVVTLPGAVVESNGTADGHTVTWTWGLRDFYKVTEVMLTAMYTDPAGS